MVYHYIAKVPKDDYSLDKLIENCNRQMKNENANVKLAIEKYVERKIDYYKYEKIENYLNRSIVMKIIENSRELGKYNEKNDVFNKK